MLRHAALICTLLCPLALAADAPPAPKSTPQWVYVLKLVPRLHDDKAWTMDDERAARAIMDSDPAVTGGIMTATLHPYAVALLRKP